MPTAQVGGRRVEYLLEGQGELVVLSSPTWWPLNPWKLSGIPDLRHDYQVLAFNHRGIGGSEGTPTEYTISSFAQDMLDLMDVLGLDRCHVVGFANGSAVALAAASIAPDRFRSMVVAAIGAGNPLRDGKRVAPPSLLKALEEQGHEHYIRHHATDDFAFSPQSRREHPERALALADALWEHAGSQEELVKHALARQGYDPLDGLERITQPVLVMVGGDDNVARGDATPAAVAGKVAAGLPNAQFHVLPGVRHMLYWEAPEACWGLVRGFLAEAAVREA